MNGGLGHTSIFFIQKPSQTYVSKEGKKMEDQKESEGLSGIQMQNVEETSMNSGHLSSLSNSFIAESICFILSIQKADLSVCLCS